MGTAEYQVTPLSRTVRQKESGLNFDGTTTAPPERSVEMRGRHQAVHVKQRHGAQGNVGRAKAGSDRRCCAPRRRGCGGEWARAWAVRCCRWCAGPARYRRARARRICLLDRRRRCGRTRWRPFRANRPGPCLRRLCARRRAPSAGQSRIFALVSSRKKAEFVVAVAGIQRRGGSRDGCGQETDDRRAGRWGARWLRGRRGRCPAPASASAMAWTCSRSCA